jgi:hypothetical protein
VSSSGEERAAVATKLHKALRDPTRAWVLAQINDAPAAAVDLEARSRQLPEGEIPRQRISYHLNMLVKYECAELIDIVQGSRGAMKKIYRGTTPVLVLPPEWAKMDRSDRNGWSIKILNEGFLRAERALEAGTFDKRLDRIAANYKPRLDEEGWAEAWELLAEIHRQFAPGGPLEAASLARSPDHMDRTPLTLSMYFYESPPGRS